MEKGCILAIDQGTTATKVLAVGHDISVLADSNVEIELSNPKPGRVEFDARSVWRSIKAGIEHVMREGNLSPGDIRAIGVTNQRETVVLWDKDTGEPVAPAISWQCRRSTPICERVIGAGHIDTVRNKTGLFIDSYYSASKIAWILEQNPALRERCLKGQIGTGTIDSWIIWNLSGGKYHSTDVSNASRTLLFNVRDKCWDDELLAIWNVPEQILPEVKMSSDLLGYTDQALLGKRIPIMGCIGDSQGALFGQCAFDKGMAKNTYGTACNFDVNIGEQFVLSEHNLQTTIAWGLGDRLTYALEGGVYIGGGVIQWLRDRMGFVKDGPDASKIASGTSDTGGVYLVPGFVGLGAPYWDSYATGVIIGLSNATSKEQVVRAGMEAIAYQVNDVLEAVQSDIGEGVRSLRADGGVSKSDFVLQFQADISNTEVIRPAVIDTTALGAAFLAGLGCGFWKDLDEISSLWKKDRVYLPQMAGSDRASLINGWKKAVERSLSWKAGS